MDAEKKRQKLEAAKQKFAEKRRKSRGNLNTGIAIDVEVLAAGVEVLVAMAELGYVRFRDFVREMGEMDPEFLEQESAQELSNIYAYYRNSLPKGEKGGLEYLIEELKNNDNEQPDNDQEGEQPDSVDNEGRPGPLRPDTTEADQGSQPLLFEAGAGANAADLGGGSGVRGPVQHLVTKAPSNYRFPADYKDPATFNKRQRLQDNIAALRKLYELKEPRQMPAAEDQEALSKYVGWGGLKQILLNPDREAEWSVKSDQQ